MPRKIYERHIIDVQIDWLEDALQQLAQHLEELDVSRQKACAKAPAAQTPPTIDGKILEQNKNGQPQRSQESRHLVK